MVIDPIRKDIVTIFGGSGFVGTQIVQLLARRGYRIRVAVRRPGLAGHLKPLGAVGQITPIQANVRVAESVSRAVQGADIVINLVGIRAPWGKQTFDAVHAKGAANVAQAAAAAGVRHLVHMSALGVAAQSPSAYARTKAEAEIAVTSAFPTAVIIRPSVLFGRGDSFFNLLGGMARLFPIMPVIHGESLFQPAYVGDVAEAFALAAQGEVKPGIYELGGPETESYRALVQRVQRETGRIKPLVSLPAPLARLLALPMKLLPNPLLTGDQVAMLSQDNVVSPEAMREKRTFAAFGIVPTAMEAVLPGYLWRFRPKGQFDRQAA